MDLHKITISGFRRFRKKNNLNVSGKLIALLGPNEAGKTSILKAIKHLGDNEAIADLDVPRGVHEETFLEATISWMMTTLRPRTFTTLHGLSLGSRKAALVNLY